MSRSSRPTTTSAGRLTSFASNLLASGVILIAGLVFGREVMQWWRPPVSNNAPAVGSLDQRQGGVDPWGASRIQFKDGPEMERVVVRGTMDDALKALRDRARIQLEKSPESPGTSAPNEGEAKLLQRLLNEPPTEELASGAKIYEIEEPFPMVAGVAPSHGGGGTETVVGDFRVVSWGLAFPSRRVTEESSLDGRTSLEWTTFTFQPAADESDDKDPFALLQSQGAHRLMTLQGEPGVKITAFMVSGDARVWAGQSSLALRDAGWRQSESWREDQRQTYGRFERNETDLEIYLTTHQDGSTRGVQIVTSHAGQPGSAQKRVGDRH